MKYLSGFYALNLDCPLETSGDWHQDCQDWDNLKYLNSEDSLFGDYGIFVCKKVPKHIGKDIFVANHIRAILDILQSKSAREIKGFRKDFLCNEYTEELFNKVILLKKSKNWNIIDDIMIHEYYNEWLRFKKNGK